MNILIFSDPILNNVTAAVLSVIYVFAIVAIMDKFVQKGFPKDFSRKVVHIAAGSWIIWWVFYDQSHWTKFLNIAPAFIWTVLLLIKGFTASPDDDAVKTMTRTGDRRELLRGPLYFTIVMNLMGTVWFYTEAAVISMAFLGWGDGLAPIFGKLYGKNKYHILSEKSAQGTLAFNLAGVGMAILFSLLIFGNFDISKIIVLGIIATAVEAVSPKDADNLLIPASIIFFYMLLY